MSLEKRIRSVFQAPKKGETYELRSGLVSQYASERKEAIQRTIQAMTLGKDVSALFPDIMKNLATHDIEQKKLVYLYLMNYAKSHPELCILAVNTFVQDSADPNPLVRALAIRTMGCIRVDKMVDYMDGPLRKTLADDNPYVRKTAAICVAKLFDLAPETAVEEGFLQTLQGLMSDSNPMVVANAVSALAEIQDRDPSTNCFVINSHILGKLLSALNECTEWGRVTLLTSLAEYTADGDEGTHIVDRVVPQFQHANPSVVLAAVKCVLAHLHTQSEENREILLRKISPPLVSLVGSSSPPEVQYVSLRNIRLILQKYPQLLSRDLRVFFVKYNDPAYLKMEKLEILVRVANDSNSGQLLAELKEYALEVDIDFVRRAVRAIGQLAIKIPSSAEKCVSLLLELLDTKINYILQEVVIVFRDILRRYLPGGVADAAISSQVFAPVIPLLCENMDEIDEPEAKAAIIWILGEYVDQVPEVADILGSITPQFLEESTTVQLQLLTAVVKLYVKKPDQGQRLIQETLNTATSSSDNADIRDRAYIYWRLLSSDTSFAQSVVGAEKPPIASIIPEVQPALLDELLRELGTLASVYHRPASTFMGKGKFGADAVQKRAIEEQRALAQDGAAAAAVGAASGGVNIENLLDIDFDGAAPASAAANTDNLNDLDGLFGHNDGNTDAAASAASGAAPGASSMNDIMSLFGSGGAGGMGAMAPMAPMGGAGGMGGGFGGSPAAVAAPADPFASLSAVNTNDAFASLNIGGGNMGNGSQKPKEEPAQGQGKANDDLLGLF